MASIQKSKQGPVWPLGSIIVVTPGTAVRITSLVDPSNVNAPETPTSPQSDEYTSRAQQIIFQAYKGGAGGHGLTANTGNIYIIQSTGNRDDTGVILFVLSPGQTLALASAPLNRNVFSLYEYYIDADNANDAAQVTAIIQ